MKPLTLERKAALGAFLMVVSFGPVACGRESDSLDAPARPHDLDAEVFKSGIHLTWQDASDNEDAFIIERAARSSAAFRRSEGSIDLSATLARPSDVQAFGHHFFELVELPENTEDYLDTDVYAGMTYFYRVKAVNDAGSSTSEELEVTFP